MSYEFYRVLHFAGIIMVLMALSSIVLGAAMAGGKSFGNRKMLSAIHGTGLLITLVAGFGLLARLGMFGAGGWPLWVIAKLVIWFIFGGLTMAIYRSPKNPVAWWGAVWFLAVTAAYLARYKLGQ